MYWHVLCCYVLCCAVCLRRWPLVCWSELVWMRWRTPDDARPKICTTCTCVEKQRSSITTHNISVTQYFCAACMRVCRRSRAVYAAVLGLREYMLYAVRETRIHTHVINIDTPKNSRLLVAPLIQNSSHFSDNVHTQYCIIIHARSLMCLFNYLLKTVYINLLSLPLGVCMAASCA